jgi:hypothetical protein
MGGELLSRPGIPWIQIAGTIVEDKERFSEANSSKDES